jgi:hypothetical protein
MSGRSVARLVFLAGAVAIGLFLFRAAPRDVTLVYALGDTGAREVDVDIRKAGETVRRAEFRSVGREVPHRVRLTDGAYLVHLRIAGDGAAREVDRDITVSESGTIVLPVGP